MEQTSVDENEYQDQHEYRTLLIQEDQKVQEDIDKTVITLSSGALGISFVFLREVVGENPIINPALLFSAWIVWGLSLVVMLVSFYLSHQAFRAAIKQVDEGKMDEPIGGKYTLLTNIATIAGGVLFLVGVGLIIFFASSNLR